ncbi:MAG: flagellar motor switch protein FliN [Planctomycetota bacterium]|jgi:flagellar motor switch protein FliN/FliY|nr:flagellar motor switch protein FliN [Planctomycetota bacterium]MDG2143187.1 flagellar motor switch protein FliN [Planctomycetota bacterium]
MSNNEEIIEEVEAIDAQIDVATDAVHAQVNELEQLQAGGGGEGSMGLEQLLAVGVEVTVEVGRTRSTFSELMKMGPGTLLELDRDAHEPADILVNGKIVANGEIVTIGDRYGVRITAVLAD